MSNKLSRNDPCPCGSGLKYKRCCLNAGPPPAPRPGNLFRMTADEIRVVMLRDMHARGAHPAIIHAFYKTDRVVTDINEHLLSAEDLAEWDAAIEEYRRAQNPQARPLGYRLRLVIEGAVPAWADPSGAQLALPLHT